MSWIHAYSREDFSFYLLCSARYEFICESVGRMEWRLDDFYSEGLLIAFENTLAARSKEIGAKLDGLTRKPDLSPTLTQMLDASESMVRSYLSSVIENANSQLLRLRLGKQLLLAENERRVAKGAAKLMLHQQLQHMSKDDLSFQMASVFGGILRVIDDLEEAQNKKDHFRKVKNVRAFKEKITDLQKNCEFSEVEIEAWVQVMTSHAILMLPPNKAKKEVLVKIWDEIFKCLGFISNNLHGLIILLEKDAHGDWDKGKRSEWIKMIDERFDKGTEMLEGLLLAKAGWIGGSLSQA